ncbi:hypothetical protein [Azospirillum picis]|uniref:Uncharacterized protein n=1 Tax=Azospirillum picis TaxID=488438 RepID=A0ABU0MRW4_9PROT|nr:hypothetical protein [Azospirillum picis]MBP2302480.1 hypothetical protein [Azospirillum picis]MDQ0536059.1 hypothetical protein [Azospirillum picis]
MHSVEPKVSPSTPAHIATAQPSPIQGMDNVQVIADRYGWSTPMARWWMSFASCSVGHKPEAMIAFLDKTVGGVTMIRRR